MVAQIHSSIIFSFLSILPVFPTSNSSHFPVILAFHFPFLSKDTFDHLIDISIFFSIRVFSVLCTWTHTFDQDVGFVFWSFDYYKHHTLGSPLEKPQMQWHSSTRFNGIATYWRDPPILRS